MLWQIHALDSQNVEASEPQLSNINFSDYLKPDDENLAAFFKGYLSAYDNGFRSYNELFGIAYTWLACKIYHELGFMPSEESLNKHRFGWKMAGLLTGIDFSTRR